MVNPATKKIVEVRNFFSQDGVTWLLTTFVKNFTGFASLGLVLTMTMGISTCEQVLMAFFALGVLLMFVRLPERGASLKLWGTALCGLAGIALSVPEIWDSTLVNFEPSDMNDPYHW